jgi:uncharacterized protein YraI
LPLPGGERGLAGGIQTRSPQGETVMRRTLVAAGLAAAFSAVPLAVAAAPAYVIGGTEIYAGPGNDYPVVAQLGPGVRVNVNGCISDYSWCDVSFSGNRGWVYAGELGYSYRNQRVPILDYGPSLSLPIISFSLGSYWDRYYRSRPFYHERHDWERRWHDHGDYGDRGRQQWHGNRQGRVEDRGNFGRNGARDNDRSDRGTQQYGPKIRDQARGSERPDLPRGNGNPHAIGPSNPNYYGSQQ